MATKAMFFFVSIAATNCFNIETYMDIWCQEPIKTIDLYSFTSKTTRHFYTKSLEHRCGLWIKHIPNQIWTPDLTKIFRTSSRYKLSVLKISDGLKISDEDFINFEPALKYLDLSGNDLDYIPMPTVKSEILSQKQSIFYRLYALDLSKNKFTNISFVQNKIVNLEELDLSQNRLTEVPLTSLSHFVGLETLLLKENNITGFQVSAGYTNIKYLDLSGNHLRDLQGCENLVNLMVLIVSYNDLQILHSNSFKDGIWSLEELHLDHNKIEDISEDAFVYFPNLKTLKLNGNRLTNLKQGIFTVLNRLESLDISNNFVTTFNAASIVSQKKLISLNLRNNLISSLNYTLIKQVAPSLTEIDVLENNFDCDFFENMLSFFKHTNINIPGGEVCIPVKKDTSCCNIQEKTIYLNSFSDTKISPPIFDPEYLIMNRTSYNMSSFFSSMETKTEALLRFIFYQFAFIVSVTLLVFVVYVYRSFGKVVINPDKHPPELHKMIQSI
ncbi:connectin-like [Coccinella septempunctata]|uniref:connectin-like n=1 Tax=Coccinella septempunctata TaxID=41139 RepID=UPI001D0895F3|nr:connectin-like [Coccinella septempunctata]